MVHDPAGADPSYAFALSRLSGEDLHYAPIGVFRAVERPAYDEMMTEQLERAAASGPADLTALLRGPDTWTVN